MHMWVSQPSSRGPGSVLMGPGAGGLRITFSRQSSEVDFCLTQSGHWNPDSSWRALPTGRPAGALTCFRHAGLLAVLQTRQACPRSTLWWGLGIGCVCAPPSGVLSGAVRGAPPSLPSLRSGAPLQGGLSDLLTPPPPAVTQPPCLPSPGLSVALTATVYFPTVVCLGPRGPAHSRHSAVS